jgi:metal-responsive CopG/Arc/MetJ family transcriptional regulator
MGKRQRTTKRGIAFPMGVLAKVDTIADEKISGNRSKLINDALKKYIRENKPKKPINKTQSAQFLNFSISEFSNFGMPIFYA